MTDLQWACREYCYALWKIEAGYYEYEELRIESHNEIEKLTGDRNEYILHNLNKFEILNHGEYDYFKLARLLKKQY